MIYLLKVNIFKTQLIHALKIIMCAIDYGRTIMARALAVKGIKLDAYLEDGPSPLMAAIHTYNKRLVSFFLQNGADVNYQTSNGGSALIFAILEDNHDMITHLIKRKADPNQLDFSNENITFSALHQKTLELLLRTGASLKIPNTLKEYLII